SLVPVRYPVLMATRHDRGLSDATKRLENWIENGDYESPVPVVEILAHLYAMEEAERLRLGKDASDKWRYFAARADDPTGEVLGGLIYVHGLDKHAGAVADVVEGSRPFTVGRSMLGSRDTLAGPGVKVLWRPLAELPSPTREEKDGRDVM